MARIQRAPLTALQVRNLPPGMHADADTRGLYLRVMDSGTRGYVFRFQLAGRRRDMWLGSSTTITLAQAREAARAAHELRRRGVDPIDNRQVEQAENRATERAASERAQDTFQAVAEAYYAAREPGWTATHQRDVRRCLDELIDGKTANSKTTHARIGHIPMHDLRKAHIREVIAAIVQRGALSYAADVLLYCRKVIQYFNASRDDAIADPTSGLRESIPTYESRNHHALKPDEMPEFLAAMRTAAAWPTTRLALRLLLLTVLRTTELRLALWSEVDFAGAKWTIPNARMKYRRRSKADHEIPLSRQALEVLHELHALPGRDTRMFPGARGDDSMMSEAAMLGVMKGAGYAGRMTGHGARAVFSSWAHDKGFDSLVVERALAHTDTNAVRAVYDRGSRWEARIALMQAWADQLDAWEALGQDERVNVVEFRRAAA